MNVKIFKLLIVYYFQRTYDMLAAVLMEKGSEAVKLLPRLAKHYVHGEFLFEIF